MGRADESRLAAHRRNRRRRWADEDETHCRARSREGFVLGEEAVARVDGLRAGGLGGFEDALPAQVAVTRRAATDVHGFVAGVDVARVGVGVHQR